MKRQKNHLESGTISVRPHKHLTSELEHHMAVTLCTSGPSESGSDRQERSAIDLTAQTSAVGFTARSCAKSQAAWCGPGSLTPAPTPNWTCKPSKHPAFQTVLMTVRRSSTCGTPGTRSGGWTKSWPAHIRRAEHTTTTAPGRLDQGVSCRRHGRRSGIDRPGLRSVSRTACRRSG